MKRIILFIVCITNIFAKNEISMDKIYSKISKNYPKYRVEFFETDNELKALVLDEENIIHGIMDTYSKSTEIIESFLYDVSGDGIEEIIIVTRTKLKNSIFIYGVEDIKSSSFFSDDMYFFRYKELEGILNRKIENYDKNSLEKELESSLPLEEGEIANLREKYFDFKGKKMDIFTKKAVVYYDMSGKRLNNKDNAFSYILKIEKNISAEFYLNYYGFVLKKIYEDNEDIMESSGKYE